jgi:hypothetical protein
MSQPTTRLAMQIAGRGRLEGHPPGEVDGARFEGRFVIYALAGADGQVLGEDVSLFSADAVAAHGRGPQSAHLVAVRSGFVLEGFVTGDDTTDGHTIGRTSATTRLRIYYDANPDGTRSFTDRASFMRGALVATYKAEEYFQIDPRAEVFDTRVDYRLLESKPFEHGGTTVDFGDLAPHMVELSHGHLPEPDPTPEQIPAEEPFLAGGPGVFADHFPVGGAIIASR